MAKQLSIIIPSCNEFPQNAFTVASVIATMECTPLDYEIIFIDNRSDGWKGPPEDYGKKQKEELKAQDKEIPEDFDEKLMEQWKTQNKDILFRRKWLDGKAKHRLRVLHYDDKQSHWCAKNIGIQEAKADTLFFMDAHCILESNALLNMFEAYKRQYQSLNGSLHMPINYLLEEPGRELIYQHIYNRPDGELHYTFRRQTERKKIYKVPCMSTCGMMISKEILVDAVGMWSWEMGIYGGGENFLNYTMAILGYDINIWPFLAIQHYAYKRGYGWTYDNFQRNRIIASYMYGGEEWADLYIAGRVRIKNDRPEVLNAMKDDIIPKCKEQREHIKSQQKYTPEEWMAKVREELPQYIHTDVE